MNNMKKIYEKPAIEAIELETEDVIQTSGYFVELPEVDILDPDITGGGSDNSVGVGGF